MRLLYIAKLTAGMSILRILQETVYIVQLPVNDIRPCRVQ